MKIQEVIELQNKFAFSNKAHSLEFRRQQLQKLQSLLRQNQERLFQAIYQDFKKSSFDTYMTELALLHDELNTALKSLKRWARPQRVRTGLANFPGRSYIRPEPLGTSLIIGAWNYPYQLTLLPAISALAAGNTVLLKPSEAPAHVARALAEMINSNFEPGYFHVVEGGVDVSQELLTYKYNKIFFTGSTAVGRIVAEAAARHLTPVTLELGGKSPCFVLGDADLARTAQRIVWGKFINAGQTCIAPDYLLVHQNIYERFLQELKAQIPKIIGKDPRNSEAYPRIINEKHVSRLQKLIEPQKVAFGGEVIAEDFYIAPTLLRDVTFSDEIMKEEIFGPLLPIIPFTNLPQMIDEVKKRPRPLALYVFTRNPQWQKELTESISFGGGSINDVLMHISNPRLPFGGVGESGMGNYHGEAGFKAFSHYKSILQKPFWLEPPVKYQPYRNWKRIVLQWLLG